MQNNKKNYEILLMTILPIVGQISGFLLQLAVLTMLVYNFLYIFHCVISIKRNTFKVLVLNLMRVLPFLLYMVLCFFSFLRVFYGSSENYLVQKGVNIYLMQSALIISFVVASVMGVSLGYKENKIQEDCIRSFALLSCVNLILWIFGFRGALNSELGEAEYITMLQFFGVNFYRQILPFTSYYNGFAIVSGAVLSVGILKYIKSRNFGIFIFMIILPFLNLLLADSRGALISSTIASLFLILTKRGWRAKIFTVILLSMTLLLYLTIEYDLYSAIDLEALTRDGGGTIFTGREFMWGLTLLEIFEFKFMHLYGYGAWGQHPSGIWEHYKIFFEHLDSNEFISLHNTYFQLFIDQGYFSLIVLLIIFWSIFSAVDLPNKVDNLRLPDSSLAILIFLIIYGLIDLTFSFYLFWNAVLFASLSSVVLLNYNCDNINCIKRNHRQHLAGASAD